MCVTIENYKPIQVEIIARDSPYDLQYCINEFIKTLQSKTIIDIKYSSCMAENCNCYIPIYSAMIMYK
jgi:hypothetical protein